jgi:hypothetical protein
MELKKNPYQEAGMPSLSKNAGEALSEGIFTDTAVKSLKQNMPQKKELWTNHLFKDKYQSSPEIFLQEQHVIRCFHGEDCEYLLQKEPQEGYSAQGLLGEEYRKISKDIPNPLVNKVQIIQEIKHDEDENTTPRTSYAKTIEPESNYHSKDPALSILIQVDPEKHREVDGSSLKIDSPDHQKAIPSELMTSSWESTFQLLKSKADTRISVKTDYDRLATIITTLTVRDPIVFRKMLSEFRSKSINLDNILDNLDNIVTAESIQVERSSSEEINLPSNNEQVSRVNQKIVDDGDIFYDDYDDYDIMESCDYFDARENLLNSFYDEDSGSASEEHDWTDNTISDVLMLPGHDETLLQSGQEAMPYSFETPPRQISENENERKAGPSVANTAANVPVDCDISVFISVCLCIFMN